MTRTARITAGVTEAERDRVLAMAKARQITVARLICRAINSLLLDEGDDSPPLAESDVKPGPKPKKKAQESHDATDW